MDKSYFTDNINVDLKSRKTNGLELHHGKHIICDRNIERLQRVYEENSTVLDSEDDFAVSEQSLESLPKRDRHYLHF